MLMFMESVIVSMELLVSIARSALISTTINLGCLHEPTKPSNANDASAMVMPPSVTLTRLSTKRRIGLLVVSAKVASTTLRVACANAVLKDITKTR